MTNQPAPWQKKYRWTLTWPGEGHEDWSAFDGDLYIGRIMRDLTTHGKAGQFMWSGGAHGRDFKHHVMPQQGWEPEHWQAAKAVEDWYDAMMERNGLPARAAPASIAPSGQDAPEDQG